jgi:sarcosine oxidase, subunit gamma
MSKANLQAVPALDGQPQARGKTAPVFQPYAQSPLHSFGLSSRARPQDDSCGVWMSEMALLGYIVVRGNAQDPTFVAAIRDVIGIELPVVPSTFTPFPHGIAIWQTPDEWLLVCARPARGAYLAELERALKNLHAQVVDNSGGLTQVYLSGTNHIEALRHVGVYDFESITPGRAVSTACGKAVITVYRHDARGVFVIFRRSFSDYVWRLLVKAARPYKLGISELAFFASHPVLRLL